MCMTTPPKKNKTKKKTFFQKLQVTYSTPELDVVDLNTLL